MRTAQKRTTSCCDDDKCTLKAVSILKHVGNTLRHRKGGRIVINNNKQLQAALQTALKWLLTLFGSDGQYVSRHENEKHVRKTVDKLHTESVLKKNKLEFIGDEINRFDLFARVSAQISCRTLKTNENNDINPHLNVHQLTRLNCHHSSWLNLKGTQKTNTFSTKEKRPLWKVLFWCVKVAECALHLLSVPIPGDAPSQNANGVLSENRGPNQTVLANQLPPVEGGVLPARIQLALLVPHLRLKLNPVLPDQANRIRISIASNPSVELCLTARQIQILYKAVVDKYTTGKGCVGDADLESIKETLKGELEPRHECLHANQWFRAGGRSWSADLDITSSHVWCINCIPGQWAWTMLALYHYTIDHVEAHMISPERLAWFTNFWFKRNS